MESHVRRNIVFALLSVAVLVVFIFLVYNYRLESSDAKSRLEAAVAEAKVYEDEVTKLKRSISSAADALSETSETARFVVGFVITSDDDMTYVEDKAAEYGFEPVIVLDCVDDLITLEALALTASSYGHEIMLTASVFSSEINDTVVALTSYMSGVGIEYSDIFLLRSDYSSEAAIEMVISDGFAGYTVYNSSPTSGVTSDGYITFDYSYLTVDSTSFTRFSSSYSNLASMIIAVDIDSIRSGTLTESFIAMLLSTVATYSENEDCEFSTLADVRENLILENETMEERMADYEAYVAECEARIDELEEIIAGIYAQLD